jgi:hypothetical protein
VFAGLGRGARVEAFFAFRYARALEHLSNTAVRLYPLEGDDSASHFRGPGVQAHQTRALGLALALKL